MDDIYCIRMGFGARPGVLLFAALVIGYGSMHRLGLAHFMRNFVNSSGARPPTGRLNSIDTVKDVAVAKVGSIEDALKNDVMRINLAYKTRGGREDVCVVRRRVCLLSTAEQCWFAQKRTITYEHPAHDPGVGRTKECKNRKN